MTSINGRGQPPFSVEMMVTLLGADRKPLAHESFETTLQDKNELGVAYTFRTDRPLSELAFIYKTPGTIVTAGFDYELRDIKLP